MNNQEIYNEPKIIDDNNEIYKTPIMENNKINKIYNPEIIIQKDEQEMNEEYENENEEINNNINNKEIFSDNNGEIFYQNAAMNNFLKNNDLKNSNSLFNSNEINEGINSQIMQDKIKYFPSNKNSIQINNRYPNNNYELENNSDNQENSESEQKSISQQEPRDKDSELEATPKLSEKHKDILENKI